MLCAVLALTPAAETSGQIQHPKYDVTVGTLSGFALMRQGKQHILCTSLVSKAVCVCGGDLTSFVLHFNIN